MNWIPFSLWNSWTPQERAEVSAYYESLGRQWAIDLTQSDPQAELQKDRDEYNEELSLGGRPVKEP